MRKVRSLARVIKDVLVGGVLTGYFFCLILIYSVWKKKKKINFRKNYCCALLGNGPSLLTDIDKLNECDAICDYFCVNFFAESDMFEVLKPVVYVFYDPIMWENNVPVEYKKKREFLYDKMMDCVYWDMVVYAPYEFRKSYLCQKNTNNNIRFVFFNSVQVEGFDWFIVFCMRFGLGLPKAPNVMIPTIKHAIDSGYKKIFVLGASHSWHLNLVVRKDSKVYVAQGHFYDKKSVEYKKYYANINDADSVKIHSLFMDWSNVFRGYWILNKYALNKSGIYNLTEDSYIDAFEKI